MTRLATLRTAHVVIICSSYVLHLIFSAPRPPPQPPIHLLSVFFPSSFSFCPSCTLLSLSYHCSGISHYLSVSCYIPTRMKWHKKQNETNTLDTGFSLMSVFRLKCLRDKDHNCMFVVKKTLNVITAKSRKRKSTTSGSKAPHYTCINVVILDPTTLYPLGVFLCCLCSCFVSTKCLGTFSTATNSLTFNIFPATSGECGK